MVEEQPGGEPADEVLEGEPVNAVEQRRSKVLQLRAAGLGHDAIARAVGLPDRRAVAVDIARALEAQNLLFQQEKPLYVSLELERYATLERLIMGIAQGAQAEGDRLITLAATGQLIRLAERRAKLLQLDKQRTPDAASPVAKSRQAIEDKRKAHLGVVEGGKGGDEAKPPVRRRKAAKS